MNNLSKDEFQSYRQYLTERLDAIEQALTGGGTFSDELNDISNQLNAIVISLNNYYRKGEQMRIADLPDNVASKDYVNNRTKGILYGQVTAPPIIDEVVEARDGDVNLKTQIQRYSKKVNLITDINALTSGEIDNTRVEPPDHNDTTNRDATDCHPEGAITGLLTDLGTINTDLSGIHTELSAIHTELSGIQTDLSGIHIELSGIQSDLSGIQTAITYLSNQFSDLNGLAVVLGYEDFTAMISCMYAALQKLLTSHPTDKPPCWQ